MKKPLYKIIWTDEAKADLKAIYDFIKNKSAQGAKKVVSEIRNAPKSVYFPDQNTEEQYNKSYKRIIVHHYKVLYRIQEEKSELIIFSVFDSRQNPDKLSTK